MVKATTLKPGDKFETIHGEKLVVLEVRKSEEKVKKGVVLKPSQTYIVAESGGHLVQFPLSKIKA